MYIYIKSMSESQSKIYDRLTSNIDELDAHLIKVALYRNSENLHHWIQEIYSFVHDVHKLKGKNKLPSKKFLLNALSINEDRIEFMILGIMEDYSDVSYDLEKIQRFVHSYHDWLAEELSTKSIVSKTSVSSVILKLINNM